MTEEQSICHEMLRNCNEMFWVWLFALENSVKRGGIVVRLHGSVIGVSGMERRALVLKAVCDGAVLPCSK